jgi:hypothetical protein
MLSRWSSIGASPGTWSQAQNGLASGFLQANGTPAGGTIVGGPNKASTYDPGIGLRYQF